MMLRPFSSALVLAALALTSAAPAFAAEPVQPPAQAPMQPPSWPQRFELNGPESASFGFPVTRPGPISISVTTQGQPVQVELDGPMRVAQSGQGRLVLNHVVTAQEVQRSIFWGVRVAVQGGAGRAAGEVSVTYPAADVARVTAAVASMDRRFRGQRFARTDAAPTAALAQVDATYEAHVARSAQALAGQRSALQRESQGAIDRVRASLGDAVTTRAIAPVRLQQPQAEAQAQTMRQRPPAQEAMTSTAAQGQAVQPVSRQQPLQVAPPVVSALSTHVGSPGTPPAILPTAVTISGSGFWEQQGKVHFLVNPGMDRIATTDWWSDGLIRAYVPDVSGVVGFDGLVWVERADGSKSAPQAFRFEPAMETRRIVTTADRQLGSPSDERQQNGAQLIRHWNGNPFWGFKGNDEFMTNTRLKNGWVFDDAFLTIDTAVRGGAYIQEKKTGTAWPYLNVRYWVDGAFASSDGAMVKYLYLVVIRGPRGVPDGVIVP